ncbi:GNAT family N-acetyltransferase [Labrenzia sp. 5N]|uniref:GNAT family N-acetyltransferase n=1 Tax=Labrenzia sp. 5N TaxID=2723402 RepID=UPI0014470775|nr:GNAT family N-acetyltransferase [Labrenzia sp. 5N]NKX65774.1 GNAT family N-acetyltransferase [Labrenzia sp. 5N]
MPLKLRPATEADAPALTDILHRAKASWGYPEEKMAEFRDYWRISEATIQSLTLTVAERDGQPIAFSGLSPQSEDTLLVDFLFVAPEAQRQGIGDLLLKRAEDHAHRQGLSRLYLESDANAGPFYEKRGFRTMATRPSEMSPGKEIPLMEKPLAPAVYRVEALNIEVSDKPWAFETKHADAIDAYFEEARKRIPMLWNGRTMKLTGFEFKDGTFNGTCAECSFAAFLAWRDWGAPDASSFNLFGSAILRSAEGALLYGVMSRKTATAGMIYPPGGNLDPTDLTEDGKVDVVGAIYRELEEETGLKRDDVKPAGLLVTFDGWRISIGQLMDVPRLAEELRTEILRFSEASEEQELADMRIIRTRADLEDSAIVPYARSLGKYLLP